MTAELELRLDQLLQRADVELLQARDLAPGEALVRQVGERRAVPQRERRLQCGRGALRVAGGKLAAALGDEVLKAVGVQLLARERQLVAALARDHGAGAGTVVA